MGVMNVFDSFGFVGFLFGFTVGVGFFLGGLFEHVNINSNWVKGVYYSVFY